MSLLPLVSLNAHLAHISLQAMPPTRWIAVDDSRGGVQAGTIRRMELWIHS